MFQFGRFSYILLRKPVNHLSLISWTTSRAFLLCWSASFVPLTHTDPAAGTEPGQQWQRTGWEQLEPEVTQTLRDGTGNEAQAGGGVWEARQQATGKYILEAGRSHSHKGSGTAPGEAGSRRTVADRSVSTERSGTAFTRGTGRPCPIAGSAVMTMLRSWSR